MKISSIEAVVWTGLALSLSTTASGQMDATNQSVSSPAVGVESTESTDLSKEEWEQVKAAIESSQYKVKGTDSECQATNPNQGWSIQFDGRGFLVSSAEKGGDWGLELEGYGAPGAMRSVPAKAPIRSEGARVTYEWDSYVEEWFVNRPNGLEHGYTILRPIEPASDEGVISFSLKPLGTMAPTLSEDQDTFVFRDSDGARIVTYSGLTVFDAKGTELPSRFSLQGKIITISVWTEGAVYPITVDPLAQQDYIKSSMNVPNGWFGRSVAIDGDYMVVGASKETTPIGLIDAGAIYVFERIAGSWSEVKRFQPTHPTSEDNFGLFVDIDNETIVVGAYLEDALLPRAPGVLDTLIINDPTGIPSNNNDVGAGAVYVYKRTNNGWEFDAYLQGDHPTGSPKGFGSVVAIEGDTLAVGSVYSDNDRGAMYIFNRDSNGAWTQHDADTATQHDLDPILAPNGEGETSVMDGDKFGSGVDLSGDLLVVGAYYEDCDMEGVVNGSSGPTGSVQNNNNLENTGAAYIYRRNAGSGDWVLEAYLKPTFLGVATHDAFGWGVAALENPTGPDIVAVGAYKEDSLGFDGTSILTNDEATDFDSGAVYVFEKTALGWESAAYVKAPNSRLKIAGYSDRSVAHFGRTIRLDWRVGNKPVLLVGAPNESSLSTGVNGNMTNVNATTVGVGAAFLFERESAPNWEHIAYLKPQVSDANDYFGFGLDIDGATVAVGAFGEDGGSLDPTDDSVSSSGAIQMFELTGGPIGVLLCNQVPATADISVWGNTNLSQFAELTLSLSGAFPGQLGYFLASFDAQATPVNVPGSDGELCIGPGLIRFNSSAQLQVASASGEFRLNILRTDYPSLISPGNTAHFQAWYRSDLSGSPAFSNGWSVTFQ